MSQTALEELKELHQRWSKLNTEFLKDGKISVDEQRRLDAIANKWQEVQKALLAAEKIDKTLAAAASRVLSDAAQVKELKAAIKKLPPDAQTAAADVMNELLVDPAKAVDPKTSRENIRKALAKLPTDQGMQVGKALNKLGVYLPNLKEDSPSAEDASARIKKIRMSGSYDDSVQKDYIRDLIAQADKQKFKVVLQIERGSIAPDDLIKKIDGDMRPPLANIRASLEILEADKEDYVWSEDNKWLSVDGKAIHTSPEISSSTSAKFDAFTGKNLGLKTGDAGFASEGHHTAGQAAENRSTNEFPNKLIDPDSSQGAVSGRKEHLSAKALANALNDEKAKKGQPRDTALETTRTYNEGGNLLVGTLPNGQPYGVIGRDGVLMSVFHLQEQYDKEADPAKKKKHEFDSGNVKARLKLIEKSLDPQEIKQTIERLKAVDATLSGKAKGEQEQAAKEFLAKIDLTKDVFAQDTKIPREQLIFVAQPEFHIDMHMRPLAPGQVMINDFKANIALINDAIKRATQPWEKAQLQSMLEHAEKMQKVMGPVVDEIAKQSKKGGLDVTRGPGVMEGQIDKITFTPTTTYRGRAGTLEIGRVLGLSSNKDYNRKGLADALAAKMGGSLSGSDAAFFDEMLDYYFNRQVNFMNAIPATKEGTNQQFYMTNFTTIKPLREAYQAYLKGKGVEEVVWVGDDGGTRDQRSASEDSLEAMGGLDCRENH